MTLLHQLEGNENQYTSVLLLEGQDLLFAGNTIGEIEVWYLPKMERRAIMRYATVDEFGDPLPVEEPVVNLSTPHDETLVYAFFGTAAYCISVELLTIIEKVPISERVVSGSIGQFTGDIGVITETGYLSRWSAKFVERVASLDFPFEVDICYLLHDYDEERIIHVFKGGRILLTNLGDDPYTVELHFPDSDQLLYKPKYQLNENFQILLDKRGSIKIYNLEQKLDIPPFLYHGLKEAERKIREFITTTTINEEDKQYITDFRLLRQSRDRYVAEVEQLKKSQIGSTSPKVIAEDGRTIHFALKEMQKENIDKRTTAMSVIEKISNRHDLNPRYIYFAHKSGATPENILDLSRYYEYEGYRRNDKNNITRIVSLLYALILLIIAEALKFTASTIMVFLVFELVGFIMYYYWVNINTKPKIPGIRSYRGLQLLMLFSLYLSLGLALWDIYGSNLSELY